ncbi:MAG: cadherin-like beta sandwich domain-containing protein [Lachnospiraceae bacterium]|nr:cadherin-like beta sandwich domain-containing protein [Lachnospiraceae bacterium]
MRKNSKGRKIAAFLLAFAVGNSAFSGAFTYDESDITYAATYTYDAEFEAYLDAQGFPESYKPYLRQLHADHPSWVFEAMHTNLGWNMTIKNEMVFSRNLVPNTAGYVSSWKDTLASGSYNWAGDCWNIISAPYWVQASEQAVKYAMDPRNFLNDTYIFQFEQLTFNAHAQTLEGTEAVLKGSFMENAIVPGTGDGDPSEYISSEEFSATTTEISGFAMKTTVGEFLSDVTMLVDGYDYVRVVDKNGEVKPSDSYIATGDLVQLAYEEEVVVEPTAEETQALEETSEDQTSADETTAASGEGETGESASDSGESTSETSETSETEESTEEQTQIIYHTLDVAPVVVMGDLNGDGMINSIDRAYMKQYVYGKIELDENQQKASDINHDGKINSIDRAYIKQFVYGKISINPVYSSIGLTYAEVFYQIGQELNVSPYMIAARVYQEQGTEGNSYLIRGDFPGFEGYYNYFNIAAAGATINDIVVNGLTYAIQNGWDSPYKSIVGGVTSICNSYIWKGQDTLYLQKFDVESTYYSTYWHQYMQNLLAPRNEGAKVYRSYAAIGALDVSYVFRIPVYLAMPEEVCAIPTAGGNPNYKLAALEIEGYEIDFNMDTHAYDIVVTTDVDELNITATPIASATKVTGDGTLKVDDSITSITIRTTAENGTTSEYVINITWEVVETTTEEKTTGETTEEETTASQNSTQEETAQAEESTALETTGADNKTTSGA